MQILQPGLFTQACIHVGSTCGFASTHMGVGMQQAGPTRGLLFLGTTEQLHLQRMQGIDQARRRGGLPAWMMARSPGLGTQQALWAGKGARGGSATMLA